MSGGLSWNYPHLSYVCHLFIIHLTTKLLILLMLFSLQSVETQGLLLCRVVTAAAYGLLLQYFIHLCMGSLSNLTENIVTVHVYS